nr:PREDICTED: interleukin-17 receptor B [Latimeria chalumnae]|eukprot:XP_014342128.1 PREDICTED: interleukin-17 receptor B [Latimeria chalumnae]
MQKPANQLMYLNNLGSAPEEWTVHHDATPSDLHKLYDPTLTLSTTNEIVLNVSWSLSADGSINELKATMVCLALPRDLRNIQCVRCNYINKFENERDHNGENWQFSYAGFTVEKSTQYYIDAYNIPTGNIGEDFPSKSKRYNTPGCKDSIMKYSKQCVTSGSLWEPNLNICKIGDKVEVKFTSSRHALRYSILLCTCKRSCSRCYNEIYSTTWNPKLNETNITISLPVNDTSENIGVKHGFPTLLHLCISDLKLIPELTGCRDDCKTYYKTLDCFKKPGLTKDSETNEGHEEDLKAPIISDGQPEEPPKYLILIGSCFICITFIVCYSVYKYVSGKKKEKLLLLRWADLKLVRILIIYSQDNQLFQNAVIAFAEFLQMYCQFEVIFDMWQKGKIAAMGPVQWLALQKDHVDKILFLCPPIAKSQQETASFLEAEDCKQINCSEDLFTLATNLFCSDFKYQSSLCKYMVVYFDEISSKKEIPGILSCCKTYGLMRDIDQFYKGLCRRTYNEIHGREANSEHLKKLKNSILKLRKR